MPVGDLGTGWTRAGRVALLATSETTRRKAVHASRSRPGRTYLFMLSCDISATTSGLNYLVQPAMGKSAAGVPRVGFAGTALSIDCRFPSTPDTLLREDHMKRLTVL